MAVVQNPIIGQARNTSGGQIFSSWKGLKVMRSKPLNVANPRTPGQLANRRRMALLASLMRTVLNEIRVGFVRFQSGTTQWAQFLKANYATGTSDNGTTASLITTALKFAQGTLLPVEGFTHETPVGQDIDINWIDNSGATGANASDVLHVLFVNADGSDVAGITTSLTRADEAGTVTAPAGITASTCKVVAFFANVAGDDVSDSQYVVPA